MFAALLQASFLLKQQEIKQLQMCTYFVAGLACIEKNPIYIASNDSKTHMRNKDANLLTYFTPMKTKKAMINSKIVPYARMLFNMADDCVPPPVTSPNSDMFGAMYVCQNINKIR